MFRYIKELITAKRDLKRARFRIEALEANVDHFRSIYIKHQMGIMKFED